MISQELVNNINNYFNTFRIEPFTIGDFPIIYFGNEEEYRNSPKKIVTVGKNPSHIEFDRGNNNSFLRFPNWNPIDNNIIEILNSYFEIAPYTRWFNSLEPLLNGLDASFYPGNHFRNRAIHTDICSPIATNPTWTGLTRHQRENLLRNGTSLWTNLVRELDPDLIIASIPVDLVHQYITPQLNNILTSFQQENQVYNVYLEESRILGRNRFLLFGRAAITPFQPITNIQKSQVGQLTRRTIWPA